MAITLSNKMKAMRGIKYRKAVRRAEQGIATKQDLKIIEAEISRLENEYAWKRFKQIFRL